MQIVSTGQWLTDDADVQTIEGNKHGPAVTLERMFSSRRTHSSPSGWNRPGIPRPE